MNELMFNNIESGSEAISNFNFNDIFDPRKLDYYSNGNKFDPEFWNNYNTIIADSLSKKVKSDFDLLEKTNQRKE